MKPLSVIFAVPGDIRTLTGGTIFDRRVLELLPSLGIDVTLCALPASFPYPSAADLAQTQTLLARADPDAILLVDGLAWGALPPDMAAGFGPRIVALCHHPLGLEAGLSAEQSRHFIANEKRTLAAAAHVIVTSASTARTLRDDFSVTAERITIAEPGVDPAPRAQGSGGAPHLLAIGSIIPRKGYDVLVTALAGLKDCDWRLSIVGSPDRASATAQALSAQIASTGLGERITLAGELANGALEACYHQADIFVMASHYEGYGMALAEAMAHGLPIVTTTGGAVAMTVPDGAGLKVPPGDAEALAEALRMVILDRKRRGDIAEASWQAGQKLPRWEETAGIIAAALRRVDDVR
ncbi:MULTISPECIES: glycosyltransferase family 4 protein [unclassified Beijerinckia]|uniref:glycosyltransferase family 4 protein n=1 Tax=unclassified Beijerinckia TaxID=2638183 RepID=UPI00089AF787|nr:MULTISPECIES: glycosyltransferase family 4 protein [unclassified Beijerinckia]MDH7796656.1 glycosyltransferase involved in cell wall biosynthesis [Beijerinckia sp. GAS462]SEC54404.1 Glycosyltransferase Family 4 [Beijerinckia sp. 28-YEA-48]